MAFEDLTKNKNFGYLKSGRRQHCCSYNKNDYKTKIQNIFSDSTKFEKYEIDENKQLSFSINSEKKLSDIIIPLH